MLQAEGTRPAQEPRREMKVLRGAQIINILKGFPNKKNDLTIITILIILLEKLT